jgi:dTMP kinase
MKKHSHFFITIEGIEGAGKSTALRFVQQYLSEHHIPHIFTREPGGTEIAEAIRALLLLKNYQEKMCSDTELLLMFASRAQHLAQVILPALAEGKWVISDRFTDASYAYQGGGRGIPSERIMQMENWVQGNLRPDRVILLDIPPALGIERIQQRRLKEGTQQDRIEHEKIAFFERARAAYLERAQASPQSYSILDASQSIEAVQAALVGVLESLKNRVVL